MPGRIIRKFREQLGYSQQEMAAKLNMSQSTYSRIEAKDEDLTIRQLKLIAAVLQVTLAELLPDDLLIVNHPMQETNPPDSSTGA